MKKSISIAFLFFASLTAFAQEVKKEEVKVKEKDLFNIRVDVKFNKETLSVLEQKAASFGLNKSQYIRKLVTSDARTKRVFSEDEIAALSRIGNNLNQNTTFANSNKILSSKLENTLDMLEEFMNRFS